MNKKILASLLIVLAIATSANAQTNNKIEVFHIENEQVIKIIPSNEEIQQEAKSFIDGVTNIHKKFDPIPNRGYMVKVPLEPSYKVENQWFNDFVDQVIIIFPDNEDPYLLLFNEKNSPIFLTFKGSTDKFLEKINFNPSHSE
ncbi:hypothetical protein [Alkalihalobacterium alkalinitrilicum]|uniref:hypothetical protein n=1 Tax=Alkalihalobacterium alkalinitrilicum TaxID=427920 RepID=UPI00099523A4|nr:hypothetical protein [Alkalihalobacterium alkalinitrilicum]